jgi:hypothetical protein
LSRYEKPRPKTDESRYSTHVPWLDFDAKGASREGGQEMKRLLVVVASVAVLAGPTAIGARAGEVKGPPGTVNNTNETGALDHANSACAASGLNDLDSEEGQNVSQVQTAADSWKYYGLPKGAPGTLGLCRGGTGQR